MVSALLKLSILSLSLFFVSLSNAATYATKEINLTLSTETVWQREQVIVTLEVITDQKFARLEADDFKKDQFFVVPVKFNRINKDDKTYLYLKWLLFPKKAEKVIARQKIDFPEVRFKGNSGMARAIKLPNRYLSVRPLPVYVSPTMPVGKLNISNKWEHGFLVSAKKLLDWQVTAKLVGVSPQTLAPISKHLTSTDSIKFLPPKKTIVKEIIESGLLQEQQFQLPIKGMKFGPLQFPHISVQFFDTDSGKLQKTTIDTPKVWVIYPWMFWLSGVFVLGLIFITLRILVPKLNRRIRQKRELSNALKALKKASSYAELRQSIRLFLRAHNTNENISLDLFAEQFIQDPSYNKISEIVKRIKQLRFSASNKTAEKGAEVNQLGQHLYRLLR